ncbi:hypothetical protein EYF80_051151 [Liparis tanakae]|uniref:Uncharacterized protein n=1 Tax=Liparis tanakae TaxID=230148 RepID=A0A4Z2FCK4_9TELE|nr:hypothetical protein EYF80_051151 [Liparis tanakae]
MEGGKRKDDGEKGKKGIQRNPDPDEAPENWSLLPHYPPAGESHELSDGKRVLLLSAQITLQHTTNHLSSTSI